MLNIPNPNRHESGKPKLEKETHESSLTTQELIVWSQIKDINSPQDLEKYCQENMDSLTLNLIERILTPEVLKIYQKDPSTNL